MEPGPNEQQLEQLVQLAEQLKLAGNKALKSGVNVEAEKLYTKAIEALVPTKLCAAKLLSQVYSNRAAVRLLRGAHAEAVDDCRKSIDADASNMKAYWRAAKGSLNLDLFEQALKFANDGLVVDSSNSDLQEVRSLSSAKLEEYHDRRQSRGITQEEAINAQNVTKQLAEQTYLIKQKIRSLDLELARNERTISMMTEMSGPTPCFKGLGRGFVKDDKERLICELNTRNEHIRKTELPEATTSSSLVEKRLANAEQELKDILQSFKK